VAASVWKGQKKQSHKAPKVKGGSAHSDRKAERMKALDKWAQGKK
jgi:hypothetical protein